METLNLASPSFDEPPGKVYTFNAYPVIDINVEFNANGGQFIDGATTVCKAVVLDMVKFNVAYCHLESLPKIPIRSGFEFVGWKYGDSVISNSGLNELILHCITNKGVTDWVEQIGYVKAMWQEITTEIKTIKFTKTFSKDGGKFMAAIDTAAKTDTNPATKKI